MDRFKILQGKEPPPEPPEIQLKRKLGLDPNKSILEKDVELTEQDLERLWSRPELSESDYIDAFIRSRSPALVPMRNGPRSPAQSMVRHWSPRWPTSVPMRNVGVGTTGVIPLRLAGDLTDRNVSIEALNDIEAMHGVKIKEQKGTTKLFKPKLKSRYELMKK